MNQITHWNPFKPLMKMDAPSNFEDLFRSFGLRPAWRDLDVMPDIRLDVSEDDKSYIVKADIPGVKKNDINVAIDGRQVEISVDVKHKTEKKEGTSLYSERSEGQAFRSFTLPLEVETKGSEARYEDGVLTLTLPKHPSSRTQRITVM